MSSKPTPGPWVVCDVPPNSAWQAHRTVYSLSSQRRVADPCILECDDVAQATARLIAEAGTVHHETGLTPQQMREQRDELLALLKVALTCIGECHSYRSHLHFKEEKQIKDALERIASVEGRS